MNTVVNQTIAREVSKTLLSIGAVTINTKKPFRYASGILSPMYTDNRLLISYPAAWKKVIAAYMRVLKEDDRFGTIDVLSGTATAAIPHAAVLAWRLSLPMVYVRSSKKDHGKGNQIEGAFPKKSRVLIIEDLISTGSSVKTNCLAIREAGGVVNTCLAITTSTTGAYVPTMKELKLHLFTLTNVRMTLEVAASVKKISQSDKESVETFLSDPPNWGKRMGFL